MQIEILGSQAVLGPGGACSGYLVSHGGIELLLDCGPGVAARMMDRGLPRLQAVLLSHMHADHVHDLQPLSEVLIRGGHPRPRLLCPPGAQELLALWAEVLPSGVPLRLHPFSTAFQIEVYDSAPLRFGDLTVEPVRVSHTVPAWGFRLSAATGEAVAYTGDTGWCDGLLELARGAGILLCEVTYPHRDPRRISNLHLSGDDAGRAAALGAAGHLVIVHHPQMDADWQLARRGELRAHYRGPVDFAATGQVFAAAPPPVVPRPVSSPPGALPPAASPPRP